MGPTEGSLVAIADAGPLIHLDELDCLDLLTDFTEVLVPETVWEEVRRHQPRALDGSRCQLNLPGPLNPPTPELSTLFRALALDPGEQEALICIQAHPGAILLTDDAAARLAAKALQVRIHGTIGILLRGIRRGQRTRSQVIDLLQQIPVRSTLHIRPTLLREIVEEVERS